MRALLPLSLLLAASAVGAESFDFGFTRGERPLDLRMAPSAEACGRCHEREYRDWLGSRHRASWSNDLMTAGFAVEPKAFCVGCHAPRPEQVAEVQANLGWYRAFARGSAGGKLPEPHADDGIDCATCHWRDGAVLSASDAPGAPHAIRVVPELADASFCASCHEFPMPAFDGGLHWTDQPMQSTYAEWTAWKADGGDETCQGCHLDGHAFVGAEDVDLVRSAVRVTPSAGQLVLEAVGVGHDVPTGDLFRHLTVDALRDGAWTSVASLGRTYRLEGEGKDVRKVLADDTRLVPGRPVTVDVDGPWRVVYHYASPKDEERGLVSQDELTAVLAEGLAP